MCVHVYVHVFSCEVLQPEKSGSSVSSRAPPRSLTLAKRFPLTSWVPIGTERICLSSAGNECDGE